MICAMANPASYSMRSRIPPELHSQWVADLLALWEEQRRALLLPLRMGDLFNELRQRWGNKIGRAHV